MALTRPDEDPAYFVGSWSHSHEEDGEEAQVFRRVGYDFPPSRGRVTLTLRPDGTAVAGSPGPDDRGVTARDGSWQLQGGVLHIRCPGWVSTFEVVAVTPQRLELRPIHSS